MRIDELVLQNFRTYPELTLRLHPSLNFFHGPNAAGKTNIIEAIHMVGMGRSHRASKDDELITWAADAYHIRARITARIGNQTVEICSQRGQRKEVKVNGERKRRLSELLGIFNVVLFTPDDLEMVKGSPAARRRFLDAVICQLSPQYYHYLARYNHVLQQRNAVLRTPGSRETLEVWDEQLVQYGSELIFRRMHAVRKLAGLARSNYREISREGDDLTVVYRTFMALDDSATVEAIKRRLAQEVQRSRRIEEKKGYTMVGPQRDDLGLAIQGAEARLFASQGQQRTIVLALKMAEMEFLAEGAGEYPVLLLDDVFSELDDSRRGNLLEKMSRPVQTLITSTNTNPLRDLRVRGKRFQVAGGKVTEVQL